MQSKNLIKGDDTMEEAIMKMAEGNPGALSVLCELLQQEDGEFVILRLDTLQIRGWKIWVGFSDYCKKDLSKFSYAVRNYDKKMIDCINKEAELMGLQ